MIEVTDEMRAAFRSAVEERSAQMLSLDGGRGILAAGLTAVLAIVEREYVMRPRRASVARDFHAHVCVSCSPDGSRPGPGCINCRCTGMDQTPCLAPGHLPHCPAGCCEGGAS